MVQDQHKTNTMECTNMNKTQRDAGFLAMIVSVCTVAVILMMNGGA